MSQFEKLIERIRTLDKSLRFDEVKKVLESYGYTMKGPASGSSHKTFRKEGCMPITIPQNNPVKITYVELVKEIIEEECDDEEENN
ncbi:MAG: toxin HicA [Lachnospiraceae bacterium]|nr:toxin HicA [Lachnospiraceae bacterium]